MTSTRHDKKTAWMGFHPSTSIRRPACAVLPARPILTLGSFKKILASTTLATVMVCTSPSFAEVTVEKTVTTTQWSTEEHSTAASGARVINFMEFDLNKNNILSIDEIGQMLFKLFDTDSNEVIDNVEYERRAVVTIVPIEKNTVVFYDVDGDGIADATTYTYETFTRDTMLTRFDKNRNGLSPREFMETDFMAADIDNDKFVDLKEWRGSYIARIDRKNKRDALFNK